MVWASQEPTDDSISGIDCVRAKPLKKRCGSRVGLSRYYSSKSQSFSSLNLVQCTPFGTSAMALAKRPSSFDLRRGSPRVMDTPLFHANAPGMRAACEEVNEEEEEGSMTFANEEEDASDRCPCNDTIFADQADAFMSPEGSPSASPLQLYDSCNLSEVGTAQCQQQRQLQLTAEYLTQLSALLPLQPILSAVHGSSSGGGGCSSACGGDFGTLSAAFSCGGCSGSSCSSAGFRKALSSGSSGSSSACVSYCESVNAASERFWQPAGIHLTAPYSAAGDGDLGGSVDRACYPSASGGSGGPWQLQPHVPNLASGAETAARQALLSQPFGTDLWTLGNPSAHFRAATGGGGTGAVTQPLACHAGDGAVGGSGSGDRNCVNASGYSSAMLPLGSVAPRGRARSTSTIPTVAATETSCAGGAGGSGSALGRKLGLAHRRLRAAQTAGFVAVQSARHAVAAAAAAGLWGAPEDMMSSLSLSDKHPQHQRQTRAACHIARLSHSVGGGGGDGGSGDGSRCAADCNGPRWQQQQQQQQPEPGRVGCLLSGFERQAMFCHSSGVGAAGGHPPGVTSSGASDRACPSAVSPISAVGTRQQQQQQQQQQELQQPHQQWLCSSAPPASGCFSRFSGASSGCC